MKRMKERTLLEGIRHHQINPVRVYSEDEWQAERVNKSRSAVESALRLSQGGDIPHTIVELGCGTADISGFFSKKHNVVGVECHEKAAAKARSRFPTMQVQLGIIEEIEPRDSDILVLCETLEHLDNPLAVVSSWLPKAKFSVISHPLDEPLDASWSGGDHVWSYGTTDFLNWFTVGQHQLIHSQTFQMGVYTIIMGVGRHV
jgi:hypothetical protein